MPKYLCNPNSSSGCVLSIFPNVYQRNHLNYNGLHLKERRDITDLFPRATDPERIGTLPWAGDALQDWTSLCVPFCWCCVCFSFCFFLLSPNLRTKRIIIKSQVQQNIKLWVVKRHLFYVTRMTFELKAIKQEKTKQFFLKFLDKKIWESLSNNQ